MTFGPDPRTKPEAKAVVAKFNSAGIDPEGYTLYTYAAVQIFADAVKNTKGADPAKLAKYIRAHSFDTVIGKLGFDKKGDVTSPAYVWYRWNDGKYAEIANP
jgi:branched-chain amino acid transport system substrate-binding protein